jgi:secondary thiamine-phosphate synthase enzyme
VRSVVERIAIQTRHDTELIDIGQLVRCSVESSGIMDGVIYVTTLHTTTGITINEGLPDVEDDIVTMLRRLVPDVGPYRHARFLPSDGQMAVNGPSHLRSALLGMQVALPLMAGQLVIGQRQTVYFVELDGPLKREFVVHVLGNVA